MPTDAARAVEPSPLRACAVCRDVEDFDLVVEDLENAMGDGWGALAPDEFLALLGSPVAADLEHVVLALAGPDARDIDGYLSVIEAAATRGISVIAVTDDVDKTASRQIEDRGARDILSYPFASGALAAVIVRREAQPDAPRETPPPAPPQAAEDAKPLPRSDGSSGIILAVQSLAGGTGSTTFAVNLAWEIAARAPDGPPRICLLDLDLQKGAVATYLDLVPREAVFELLQDIGAVDSDSLVQALQTVRSRLSVLTAPVDMLPLDLVSPDDIDRLLDMAAAHFDVVVVDMPASVVMWTETVLSRSESCFAVMESDMRSAQNAQRLIRALQAEDLPVEKLRYVLNRAPGATNFAGRTRQKRLAESLGIAFEICLPDGGRPVTDANDQGRPLAIAASRNRLRKAIRALAASASETAKDRAAAG